MKRKLAYQHEGSDKNLLIFHPTDRIFKCFFMLLTTFLDFINIIFVFYGLIPFDRDIAPLGLVEIVKMIQMMTSAYMIFEHNNFQ